MVAVVALPGLEGVHGIVAGRSVADGTGSDPILVPSRDGRNRRSRRVAPGGICRLPVDHDTATRSVGLSSIEARKFEPWPHALIDLRGDRPHSFLSRDARPQGPLFDDRETFTIKWLK